MQSCIPKFEALLQQSTDINERYVGDNLLVYLVVSTTVISFVLVCAKDGNVQKLVFYTSKTH